MVMPQPQVELRPPTRPSATGPTPKGTDRYGLLALGFRPFFLVAGLLAVLSLAAWLAVLLGLLAPPRYLAGSNWHAHEMLFGYTAAVTAGFLLTAVRNWSGMPTATGGALAALVGLWVAARLAPWLGLPDWLAGGLDIAFFPALALALRRPLWHGPNRANRLFLAVLGGASLLARLAGWHDRRAWGLPMLAVLYLGLLWLAAGLILDGLADFRLLPPSVALHVITAGAIGTMTLGMMARVTLGHTGRPMRASRATTLAFALVTAAALLRGPAVWLEPALYQTWMLASGACWIGAFVLFVAIYGPMLLSPRIDGKPG